LGYKIQGVVLNKYSSNFRSPCGVWTRERAFHFYSPGVAACMRPFPPALLLLLH